VVSLRKSLLALAVSDFELLISEVAEACMRELPRLVNDEQAITLEQLKTFDNVEQATAHVIQRQVADLMRQDLFTWEVWFQRVGVKLRDTTDSWPLVVEILARRNVIVHNDGKANGQYLSKIDKSTEHPPIGFDLAPDDAYLRQSVERLYAMGILLASGANLQIKPEESDHVLRALRARASDCAEDGRFLVAHTIASVVLAKSRGRMRRELELEFKKILWVSMRECGSVEQMLKDVEQWDVTGLDRYYAHVRAVLLREQELAIASTNSLIRAGRLSPYAVANDPLYNELRHDVQFIQLFREIDPAAPAAADPPSTETGSRE
jgi:hypothetical protein